MPSSRSATDIERTPTIRPGQIWLCLVRNRNDRREHMTTTEMASIDRSRGLPEGTTERMVSFMDGLTSGESVLLDLLLQRNTNYGHQPAGSGSGTGIWGPEEWAGPTE